MTVITASNASTPAAPVNLLAYLRSKSSIDYDSLDLKGGARVEDSGPRLMLTHAALQSPQILLHSQTALQIRLIMKVPSTWEGLQACSRLKADNIKTLATTLFTMEQAILAGEAGCTSISPFVHELRAHLEPSYHDSEPIHALVPQAQQYYRQHGISTKVKACAFMTSEEIISFAGVDAMTVPAEVLEELSSKTDVPENLGARSVIQNFAQPPSKQPERLSYINDKSKFDRAFTTNGRGKAKTEDAIAVFCNFQIQAEAFMTTTGFIS
ncbi:hypothetical protein CDD83_7659 [Cordyceps sp. RAO-2017]|nr:hypothetical protein CDD83_7659 [Cordyceps sp. RAO-2017]